MLEGMRGALETGARGRVLAAIAILSLAVTASAALAGGRLKTKSASTTIGPFPDTGSVTAKCKRGQKAISGGFAGDEGTTRAITPYSSKLDGRRRWTISAVGTTDEGTLTSYAYCREARRLKTFSETVTVPPMGTTGTGTASAKCPAARRVVSGGFETDSLGLTPQIFPYSSRKEGKRTWTVSVVSYSSQPGTMTSFAYCRKTDRRLRTKSASTAIAPSLGTGTATAKCRRGRRVVSGGFDNPDFDPDIDAGPQILVFESVRQSRREWTASAYNEGSAPGTFTVYAYCEKKRGA